MRIIAGLLAVLTVAGSLTMSADADTPSAEELKQIQAAAPGKAYIPPAQVRKLLVFSATRGFRHDSIPEGVAAMRILGEKTGAFTVAASEDVAVFEPDALRAFDAVCLLSTTGELFRPADFEQLGESEQAEAKAREARLKRSLLDFVANGGGLIGIHAATDCFYKWPAFGELIGGYFDGHPWHERVTLKLDETGHPLTEMFDAGGFTVTDEIYQIRDPYSRDKSRVLLSLDTQRTDMSKDGIKRIDGDFPVSWVRKHGKGRVFYCSLGHREEIFWNPTVLEHYLAGIQFALGDLAAAASPRTEGDGPGAAVSSASGWTELFNGRDLSGWKGLVGDPKSRAAMTAEELAAAQKAADERMREHWRVEDGVLVFDGKGDNLCTAKEYGDFELTVDWKIAAGGDSGIYLRGSPQVQIWDPAQWPEGSGGLYNNQRHPSKPIVRADNPIGEWNTFRIRMVGERVSVWLNKTLVVDDVPLENYWERDKPIYPRGQIELQSHNSPLWFRNIRIREIPPAEAKQIATGPEWHQLLASDTSGWQGKSGAWTVEDGIVTRKGGGTIFSEARYGDFLLDLEFRISEGGNSGIFFRVGDPGDYVQTGIEFQVLDSRGKSDPGTHDCGAIYDCLAPQVNAERPAGEWNHVVIRCKGPQIDAWMNGRRVIDMDLERWTEPNRNPDGTKNKFNTAFKDMPRSGHLGLQDHGDAVWYRNMYVKPLAE